MTKERFPNEKAANDLIRRVIAAEMPNRATRTVVDRTILAEDASGNIREIEFHKPDDTPPNEE